MILPAAAAAQRAAASMGRGRSFEAAGPVSASQAGVRYQARKERLHMADRIERVLVITAHPDDSEFGAGGTVAKFAKEGRQVTYCILTNGNKGSSDRSMTPERLAGVRAEEQ